MSSVKLIGITQPCVEGISTADELVAYAARVSNPANQMNTDTAPKLIKYLIKHKHWSPFEMVSATLEIKTTRDIGRQILRHRSFSFQEFSQRYAIVEKFATREARLQDEKNRQNSILLDENDEAQRRLNEEFRMKQIVYLNKGKELYQWATSKGIAKEQARAVLPEGMTLSTLYMAGTLRSWIHYIDARTDMTTQQEHREIAELCKQVILNSFPSLGEYYAD